MSRNAGYGELRVHDCRFKRQKLDPQRNSQNN